MTAAVILWTFVALMGAATVALGRCVRRARKRQAELRQMVARRLAAFDA